MKNVKCYDINVMMTQSFKILHIIARIINIKHGEIDEN